MDARAKEKGAGHGLVATGDRPASEDLGEGLHVLLRVAAIDA
jgi:hypothetical protein